jgi:hypothetical protein
MVQRHLFWWDDGPVRVQSGIRNAIAVEDDSSNPTGVCACAQEALSQVDRAEPEIDSFTAHAFGWWISEIGVSIGNHRHQLKP